MSKRTSFIIVFFVFIFALTLNAKVGIELRGGAEIFSPSEFNTDFSNVFVNSQYYSVLPDDKSKLDEINPMLLDVGTLIKFFVTDNVSINFKAELLANDTDNIINIDDIECLYSHAVFTIGYFGLGASYNYPITKNFILGLNASGGLFANFSSFWEIGAFDDPGAITKLTQLHVPLTQSVYDITDVFFGGDIEVGIQYLFLENAGISIFGGYRIANYSVSYPSSGVFAEEIAGEKIMKAQSINFSGPYFGGGFVFYLGGESKPQTAKAKSAAEISKYEKYGDTYYKQKNYDYALKYYSAALKTSPNPGLYKKLGLCSYYLKDITKTIEYMQKYLESNPDDVQMKEWLEKIR
ncbi:MAG: tetratricopeptide repeat protein [Candidatus Goldbacteria bacterium]|nr:tetratricopeptide repeat protein [Candidatus Goldiibacteriota bacterium]HPD19023.1 tetratricopeptide repeat protein [Candidatus Goldiibacteriota bacterium]